MDIVERLRGLFSNSYGQDEIERAIDILEDAADEIERLRENVEHLHKMTVKWMVLFDPSTTQEMAAATLNFANDEIKRLQERNHALRKALQLIAAPSKVVVKGEEAVVALRLVLSSHRMTALKALGEKE